MTFDLTVSAHKENLHSGYSGIAADPYFVGMELIQRIVDFKTHEVKIPELYVEIPPARIEECKYAAGKIPRVS